MTENYTQDLAIPSEFFRYSGPKGVAIVRAWPTGQTDKGWGGDTFGEFYAKGRFSSRAVLHGYELGRWSLAFVMRALRLVCIDIDGKNGGFTHAGQLGMLPYTLAETSKSGNGYHLFYSVNGDQWDDRHGYAMLGDRIGLEQGVDLRAVGCVYHHPQQRWNDRQVAPLPEHLKTRLLSRKAQVDAQVDEINKILATGDPLEVAMKHDELITNLNKPIPNGKRNTTLFAIGSQMLLAQVPNWANLVHDRALAVGLDHLEADKLIANITRYGDS